jgi:hypothetical protein
MSETSCSSPGDIGNPLTLQCPTPPLPSSRSSRSSWLSTSRSAPSRHTQVGSKIPSIELDHGFAGSDGVKVNVAERAAGKKIILVGLPGAFTPT